MAYIIGLLTPEEEKRLEARGWSLEDAPKELVPATATPGQRMRMVWVDADMVDVMTGWDWEPDPSSVRKKGKIPGTGSGAFVDPFIVKSINDPCPRCGEILGDGELKTSNPMIHSRCKSFVDILEWL